MLNYLWGSMIIIGVIVATFNGSMEEVSNGVLDSAGEAVTLCITMLGIMSFWTGLIQIARAAGLMDKLTRLLEPINKKLFPRLPRNHVVNEYIASNMIANILGLGWAATPMGLKAMKELAQLERERLAAEQGCDIDNIQLIKASDEMCTFLIINISSLQLIPVSIIAYRTQYGSANPAAIVMPALLATTVSTLVAIVFCRVMCRRGEKG